MRDINDVHIRKHSKRCEVCSSTLCHSFIDSTVFLDDHHKVIASGKYNFEGYRIPVNEILNIEYINSLLHDYNDPLLCDFLEFGFLTGYHGNNEIFQQIKKKDVCKFKNHKGAEEYKEDTLSYLVKESIHKAIIGPFKENTSNYGIKIGPLNSVPKKDSFERQVILDFSFPKGTSLNDYLNKDEYLGETCNWFIPKLMILFNS